MSRISPQSIEQVAAANDIVEVIGSYLPLKRAGSTFKALCPFHREKTPSFNVNPARQTFKCFGCGAGGSVFRFVMTYENLDFPAAVRRLAERAGVPIVEEAGGRDAGGEEEGGHGRLRRRLLALHGEVADWFHRNLMKTEGAAHAREYLKKREFGSAVAVGWKLGHAPDSWDAFSLWARERGYTVEELLASGLVKPRDEEAAARALADNVKLKIQSLKFYDRFRDRLMFPICNELGEVIAFSGRVLAADAENVAKYVNSPETPLFTKGKILFGLNKSRRAILDAKSAVVCEGQLDLIRAFEAGVTNVTAPQGTAFTEKQARLLKRYADEAVLCFDADAAGQQAAERSFAALLDAGLTVRVATMPAGEDPDSLIRTQGADAFRQRLAEARDFFDFQIERLGRLFDLDTPRGQTQFSRRMAESVALVGDAALREAVAGKVSARIGVPIDSFRALVRGVKRHPLSTYQDADERAERVRPPDLAAGAAPATASRGAPPPPAWQNPPNAIAQLLTLALRDPAVLTVLQAQPKGDSLLARVPGGEILARVLAAPDLRPDDPASLSAFFSTLPATWESYLSSRLLDPVPEPAMEEAEACWLWLEQQDIGREVGARTSRLRLPGLSTEEQTALQKEVVDLQKRLLDIARLLSSRRPVA